MGGDEEDSVGCCWRPVCANESWWMRKGTTSVGAVAADGENRLRGEGGAILASS